MARESQNGATTILIVDDEAYVRDLIGRWLIMAGYQCFKAAGTEQAWKLLQEIDIDLVTSDLRMRGPSGLELLERIETQMPNVAFIMVTAHGELGSAVETLTHGAAGYLTKPVERDELLFQVHNALERRRLTIENREHTRRLEEKVREQTYELRRAHEETIHRLLNASQYRDEETGAHVRRTGLYSEILARASGWPQDEIDRIRMAAPMHDVGKIGIPDAILRKPGRLTPHEFEIMKTHTLIGAAMLDHSDSPMLEMARQIALFHHEHWNGQGYPYGLHGLDIPCCARIVAIVDVYDALSHKRVYHPARPENEVLKIMREGRGTQFDPQLLDLFLELLPEMRRIMKDNPDEAFSVNIDDPSWLLASTENITPSLDDSLQPA